MIPDAPLNVRDGGLGLVPPSSDRVHAIIGVCSSGTPNQLYSYRGDADQLVAELVSGPAVEAGAVSLFTPGNGGVIVVPVTHGVAGTLGAVTAQKDPATQGTFSADGEPKDDMAIVVKFLTGVEDFTIAPGNADGTFVYSLDDGKTWSDVYSLPTDGLVGSFEIPGTGVTFTVENGAGTPQIVAGDTYSLTATGPGFTSSNLVAAIDALLAASDDWNFLHVVGRAATAEASAAIAGVLAAKMTAAQSKIRYTFAMMEAAADSDANLKAAFASFADTRVMVCAGDEYVTSPLTGRQNIRSVAWTTAARLGSIDISQSAAAVEDGPLKFATKIVRDENATPGLDDARFVTHRTFTGRPGVYVGLDRMMAPVDSDYWLAPLRRVMDRACQVARHAAVNLLARKVRTNGRNVKPPLVPGALTEAEAKEIETLIGGELRTALIDPGHAQAASATISRTANLISNRGSAPLKVRLEAFGLILQIPIDIGFVNPATQG